MKKKLLIINQKLQQLLSELSEIPVESAEDMQEWLHAYKLTRTYLTNNQQTLYIGGLYNLRKKKRGGDRRSKNQSIKMSD